MNLIREFEEVKWSLKVNFRFLIGQIDIFDSVGKMLERFSEFPKLRFWFIIDISII